MRKYFITKNFIGYPTDVISGEYSNKGYLVKGPFDLPKKLSKKFPGFDTLNDILKYKMCSCGKDVCEVNKLLYEIVNKQLLEL